MPLPNLLSRSVLRERLKPELKPKPFANWLHVAQRDRGFPVPIRTGARTVAWREDEVLAWLEARPRGGTFDGKRRQAAA